MRLAIELFLVLVENLGLRLANWALTQQIRRRMVPPTLLEEIEKAGWS